MPCIHPPFSPGMNPESSSGMHTIVKDMTTFSKYTFLFPYKLATMLILHQCPFSW